MLILDPWCYAHADADHPDVKMIGVIFTNLDLLWGFQKYIIYGYLLQLKPSRTFLNLEDILIITIFLMDVKMIGVTITNLDFPWGFQKYMICCILDAECWYKGSWVAAKERLGDWLQPRIGYIHTTYYTQSTDGRIEPHERLIIIAMPLGVTYKSLHN